MNGDDDDVSPSSRRSSSPESFAGFSPSDIKEKAPSGKLDGDRSTPATPKGSTVRVGIPRSSKTRASLVWQNPERFFEVNIKEEPEDNISSPGKSKKPNKSTNVQIKTESDDESNRQQKRMRKPKDKSKVDVSKVKNKKSIEPVNGSPVKEQSKHNKNENLPSCSNEASEERDIKQEKKRKVKKRRHGNIMQKSVWKCDSCGRKYAYLRGLRQHKKLECNVEPQFPCPYCPMRFRYRHGIREHVRNYHEQAFPKWYATHYVIPMLVRENAI